MSGTRRRLLVLSLAGFLAAALLVIVALLLCLRQTAEPGVVYGVPPDVPMAAANSLGVSSDLSKTGPDQREQRLAAIEDAGFRWLRQRFPWDAVETEPGVFDWNPWDAIIHDATRHNLSTIAVLDGSPVWSRSERDAGNPLAPPVEMRDYGAFVAAFAQRYRDQIDYYQIWDEPNIYPHWGEGEVDPVAYGKMLREAAIQIRAVDPSATVLLAALAPNVETQGANMSELLFLDALYDVQADEWFDVVAAQQYSFGLPIGAPADTQQLNWRRVGLLREVMLNHGDSETAVWDVSFGLLDESGDSEPKLTALEVAEAIEMNRRDWPWLGPMLWAAWSADDPHGEYRLANGRGELALPHEELRTLAASEATSWPGVYPPDHPSAHYAGNWRVTQDGADIGDTGDRLAISFWGDRIDLTVRKGAYRAFLYASVDGQPANALPLDSAGRAYLVLYDPSGRTQTTTLARDLSEGHHSAEIWADRGWGQWAIGGWTAVRDGRAAANWPAVGLALAACLLAGLSLSMVWPARPAFVHAPGTLLVRLEAVDDRLALTGAVAAASLVYIAPGTLPSLVCLACLFLVLLVRPKVGLPLIAFSLSFYQVGKPLLGRVFSMVEILTLVTAAAYLLSSLLRNGLDLGHIARLPRRLTLLDIGMLLLVVVGALSLLWAQNGREAMREYRIVVLEAVIFYCLIRVMIRGQRDTWLVADAWVLGAAVICLVAIYQWTFGQNLIVAEGVARVRGFYGSPNNLALFLVRVLPLGIAIAAWTSTGLRRWAYGLFCLLVGLTTVLTYSRGAWLLGVPVSLLFLTAMRGWRAFLVAFAALSAGAVAVVIASGQSRLSSLFDPRQGTTFFRIQLWRSSWAMVREHPLLGVGLDNFLYRYRSRYVSPAAWEELNLSHPHNIVLDFWLRLGLLGVLVLGWLLVAFFRCGFRTYRRLADGDSRMLVLGLMAGMVGGLAHGLVDNAFFLVDLAFSFTLMAALLQVMELSSQSRKTE